MSRSPFFSIVLPTLNWANYTSSAIRSTLNQTFGDFELIVSDNSSTDNAAEVAREFADERVRYVKTEKTLPIGASFNFALSQARGEYVTFLGDDDAHSSIYLESLARIINEHNAEVVGCRLADYYYYDHEQKHGYQIPANSLLTHPFDNQMRIYDAKRVTENIFALTKLCKTAFDKSYQPPLLINAVYHHSLFDRLRKTHGEIFPKTFSGDFFVALMTLNEIDKYFYLDSPLAFHGISAVSTTMFINRSNRFDKMPNGAPPLSPLKFAPVKTFAPLNFVADAILEAKSKLGGDLDYIKLDYADYLDLMSEILDNRELAGNDVDAEKTELAEFIANRNEHVRQSLGANALHWRKRLRNSVRLKIYGTVVHELMLKARPAAKLPKMVIAGRDNNFENIVECGQAVGEKFLSRYAETSRREFGI